MSDIEQLQQQVDEQGRVVRDLKAAKAEKPQLDEQVALLLALKKKLQIASGNGEVEADGPKKKSGGASKALVLKEPKGTKDYTPKEMALRTDIFRTITSVFEKHGAVTIDTPVFELKEILVGKYGEDSKLIYDLKDQGGEECSLRYDLTVPFARFVAQNGISNIKRYHLAKVYRRDQPAITKGRMREFYQCDYDIAGVYDPMIPDAECVRVAVNVLTQLDVGKFVVKLNHRKILDAIFEVSGVPADKVRAISSAVDKLDKAPWAEVRREMTQEKGLDAAVADRIGEYVQISGSGEEVLARLQAMPELMASAKAQEGVKDMGLFFRYAKIFGILDYISFDMSLARGLDYYTGVIYEAVLVEENVRSSTTEAQSPASVAKKSSKKGKKEEEDESQIRVGSIAAGGRYDELVGMFSSAMHTKGKKTDVPCVGISFGVERIFSIIKSRKSEAEIKANRTQVYVISLGDSVEDSLLEDRMRIAAELWDAGIAAEFPYKIKPRPQAQYDTCDSSIIPWAVIIGKDELSQGTVKIKNMAQKVEEEKGGVVVSRSDMIAELKQHSSVAASAIKNLSDTLVDGRNLKIGFADKERVQRYFGNNAWSARGSADGVAKVVEALAPVQKTALLAQFKSFAAVNTTKAREELVRNLALAHALLCALESLGSVDQDSIARIKGTAQRSSGRSNSVARGLSAGYLPRQPLSASISPVTPAHRPMAPPPRQLQPAPVPAPQPRYSEPEPMEMDDAELIQQVLGLTDEQLSLMPEAHRQQMIDLRRQLQSTLP